jgi:hypothetical protein
VLGVEGDGLEDPPDGLEGEGLAAAPPGALGRPAGPVEGFALVGGLLAGAEAPAPGFAAGLGPAPDFLGATIVARCKDTL